GLAVETVILGAALAKDFRERTIDGAAPRAIREQQRTVDVEQHELHVRVSNRPEVIDAAPTPCHTVGNSPSSSHATATAKSGCRLEYIAVRVGPITRTPRYQKRYAITSAPMPLYTMAAHTLRGTSAQCAARTSGSAKRKSGIAPPIMVIA